MIVGEMFLMIIVNCIFYIVLECEELFMVFNFYYFKVDYKDG